MTAGATRDAAAQLSWSTLRQNSNSMCSVAQREPQPPPGFHEFGAFQTRRMACLDLQERFDRSQTNRQMCFDYTGQSRTACADEQVLLPIP